MLLPVWLHIPHWLYLMPGIYTLLLAVLAGVVPTVKWYEHRWVKITYGCTLGMLCLLEVASIRNDRQIQDSKHASEMGIEEQRFNRIVNSLEGIQRGQIVQSNAESALSRESQRTEKISVERQLKIRALDLSRHIGQFTTQVHMQEVAVPTPTSHGLASINDPAWADWQAQLENIEHNAVAQYNSQFGASVKDVVEQLKKRGVLDRTDCDGPKERPDRPAPSEVRFMYVLGCAQDLQLAASKLH